MKRKRKRRISRAMISSALTLQLASCDANTVNDYMQTILLGVTAAGAVVIIQNI